MRVVQASEAKARFSSLLDDVENGETVVITRNGKCVARLTPDEGEARKRRIEAFDTISEIRKRTLPISLEDLLQARHAGHKY